MSTPQTAAAPQATATPAAAAPTQAEVRNLKLKLDGQDVEMPESEVIALAQQGKVAGKRFQEAAGIKKQAEDLIKYAKENPREFFKQTGLNIRDFSESYLMEELQKEAMSPEQRKASENEAKLKQYEDEKKNYEANERQREIQELEAKHAENYNNLFVDALTKSNLPKTAYTIKRMAELQLISIKKGLELNPDQLAKIVREDYINEQKLLFGSTEGDKLIEMFGPELMKKLSKAQLSKLKGKGLKTTTGAMRATPAESGGLTWREYQKRNRR